MSRNPMRAGLSVLIIGAIVLSSSLLGVPLGGASSATGLDTGVSIQPNGSEWPGSSGAAEKASSAGSGAGSGPGNGTRSDREENSTDSGGGSGGGAGSGTGSNGGGSGSESGAAGSEGRSSQSGGGTQSQKSSIGLSQGNTSSLGGPVDSGDPKVQFVVQAEEGAYWRAKAYDSYTGREWVREVSARPAASASRADGDVLTHRITAKQPLDGETLPTAWRPRRVADGSEYATVADDGRLRSEQPVESGDSYTVRSVRPETDPERLRAAGSDDPPAVTDHYTDLPEGVPDRVDRRTAEIVADADTRYGQASAVEDWLERNKNYSLDAAAPESNFVDTFLFEQDEGYCQYFASSMTVMLRSQGVPARYVTGYSPGQRTADGTEVVRSMNAHAWVEVYFPGEGWVQFDPTPSSGRVQSEQQSLASARASGIANTDTAASDGQSYSPARDGSPGEESKDGESRAGDEGSQQGSQQQESGQEEELSGDQQSGDQQSSNEESDDQQSDGEQSGDQQSDGQDSDDQESEAEDTRDPSYEVSVSGSQVPGTELEVSVTRDGAPASGVTVLFNDDPVGETAEDGTVTGQVPYVKELVISIEPPEGDGSGAGSQTGRASLAPPGLDFGGRDLYAAVASPHVGNAAIARSSTQTDEGATNGTVTLDVESEITVTAPESPVPGAPMELHAATGNSSTSEAAVRLDGRFVGRTNAAGNITFEVPYEESMNLTVERGEITGSRRLEPRSIELAIEGDRTPAASATVTATAGDSAVPEANVTVADEPIGRTDANGARTFTFPFQPNVTVRVERGGLVTSRTIDLPDELNVTTSGFVFPGRTVTATTRLNGTVVDGAKVQGAGDVVGSTDQNGQLEVGLPVRNSYRVSAEKGELSGATTVSGILVLPGVGVVVLAGLVGAVVANRYFDVGPSPSAAVRRLRRVVSVAYRGVVSSLVGLVASLSRLLERLRGVARALLTDTVATLRRTPGLVGAKLRQAHSTVGNRLRAIRNRVLARVRDLRRVVDETDPRDLPRVVVAALRSAVRARRSATGQAGPGGSRQRPDGVGDGETADTPDRIDVRQAWEELTASVRVRSPRTATAVRYRDRATADGFPPDPVATLTELYRKVEYSHREPTVEDERAAWEALQSVRGATRGDAE